MRAPRINGKAERFIQPLLREWAYAFIYPPSNAPASELAPWMYHYNFHRLARLLPTALPLLASDLMGTTS